MVLLRDLKILVGKGIEVEHFHFLKKSMDHIYHRKMIEQVCICSRILKNLEKCKTCLGKLG